jgi:hypothetical protein
MASASVSGGVKFKRTSLLSLGGFGDFPWYGVVPLPRGFITVMRKKYENFAILQLVTATSMHS